MLPLNKFYSDPSRLGRTFRASMLSMSGQFKLVPCVVLIRKLFPRIQLRSIQLHPPVVQQHGNLTLQKSQKQENVRYTYNILLQSCLTEYGVHVCTYKRGCGIIRLNLGSLGDAKVIKGTLGSLWRFTRIIVRVQRRCGFAVTSNSGGIACWWSPGSWPRNECC